MKLDPVFQGRLRAEKRRLGAQFLMLRRRANWTQEEAAEKIGIHAKYLSRVENGSTNPTLEVLLAMAEAYEVSLHALFLVTHQAKKNP